MSLLKWTAIVLVVGYACVAALMYVAQRSLMYFPDPTRTAPAAAGLSEASEVVIDTPDGEKTIIWHAPPRDGQPVVLYLHGNGGALVHRVPRFHRLIAGGLGIVALSYRGYGGSTGSPSEAGLVTDARTAYDFAIERYPASRIVIWGESLGSGVAVALAAEKPAMKLVLEAPFTAAVDIAAAAYPFLPARLIMKDQFRSSERIGRVTAPVLILHGDRDDTVPIRHGERLYDMIRASKRMVRFAGGGHNNLDDFGASDAALTFIAE